MATSMDSSDAIMPSNVSEVSSNLNPLASSAKEAGDLFKQKKYRECLNILYELQKSKGRDLKVLHNITIAEFHRDGFADPKKVLEVLDQAKQRSDELRQAAEQKLETAASSSGQPGAVGPSGSASDSSPAAGNDLGSSSAAGTGVGPSAVYMEEYDASIATLNMGIMMYHMKQHEEAYSILEPLFRNIEPVDEGVALRLCLLLLDTSLALQRPGKAAEVLAYMEKAFTYLLSPPDETASLDASGPAEPALGLQPEASERAASVQDKSESKTQAVLPPSTDEAGPLTAKAPSPPPGETSDARLEEEFIRIVKEEGINDRTLQLALQLPVSSTGASSGEKLAGSHAQVAKEQQQIEGVLLPAGSPELKLLLHLYKARLLLLTRNLKSTKREVKLALGVARDHLQGLLLKAQLGYARSNYRKSLKVLAACKAQVDDSIHSSTSVTSKSSTNAEAPSHRTNSSGPSSYDLYLPAVLLNNLACVHQRLGKHNVAAMYFSKALRKATEASYANSQASPDLRSFSRDCCLPVLYNAGLQQLLSNRPLLAARCFQEAIPLFYKRPLLWLRLAECCVAAHNQKLLDSPQGEEDYAHQGSQLVTLPVIGKGMQRRIILPLGSAAEPPGRGDEAQGAPGDRDSQVGASPIFPPEADLFRSSQGRAVKPTLGYGRRCLHRALHLLDSLGKDLPGSFPTASEENQLEKSVVPPDAEPPEAGGGVEGGSQTEVLKSNQGADSKEVGSLAGVVEQNDMGMKVSAGGGSLLAGVKAFEEEQRRQMAAARQCAFADLAYCELGLGNPKGGLNAAQWLLSIPDCSQPSRFAARMYAAEALCLLDRMEEAVAQVSTCMLELSTSSEGPAPSAHGAAPRSREDMAQSEGHKSQWAEGNWPGAGPQSQAGMANGEVAVTDLTGPTARATLFINRGAVLGMRGELEQAHRSAKHALSMAPSNPLAVLSVVYLELRRGRTEEALTIIKHCRNIRMVTNSFEQTS